MAQLRLIKKKTGRTRRVGGQLNNGNSVVHGFYASFIESMFDQRRKESKAVNKIREQLVDALGGAAALTPQQAILVDRVVVKTFKCALAEGSMLAGEPGPDGAHYLALANSLRLDLCALGLAKRAQDVPNLRDYLASKSRQPA
jgi:hypothetical protein